MKSREIGRTGLHVTALGFGGAPLGNLFAPMTDADGAEPSIRPGQMAAAISIRHPITAIGLSERRMGDALRQPLAAIMSCRPRSAG